MKNKKIKRAENAMIETVKQFYIINPKIRNQINKIAEYHGHRPMISINIIGKLLSTNLKLRIPYGIGQKRINDENNILNAIININMNVEDFDIENYKNLIEDYLDNTDLQLKKSLFTEEDIFNSARKLLPKIPYRRPNYYQV
jgi:hypothetical protein